MLEGRSIWYDDVDDMIGGLVHVYVLISLNKLNNEKERRRHYDERIRKIPL